MSSTCESHTPLTPPGTHAHQRQLPTWKRGTMRAPVASASSSSSTPPTQRTAGRLLCSSRWLASSSKPAVRVRARGIRNVKRRRRRNATIRSGRGIPSLQQQLQQRQPGAALCGRSGSAAHPTGR